MFWFLNRRCRNCNARKVLGRKRAISFMYREANLMKQIEDRDKVLAYYNAENQMLKAKLEEIQNNRNCCNNSGDYTNNSSNQ